MSGKLKKVVMFIRQKRYLFHPSDLMKGTFFTVGRDVLKSANRVRFLQLEVMFSKACIKKVPLKSLNAFLFHR